jgi:hypothetical protein
VLLGQRWSPGSDAFPLDVTRVFIFQPILQNKSDRFLFNFSVGKSHDKKMEKHPRHQFRFGKAAKTCYSILVYRVYLMSKVNYHTVLSKGFLLQESNYRTCLHLQVNELFSIVTASLEGVAIGKNNRQTIHKMKQQTDHAVLVGNHTLDNSSVII